MNSRLVLQFDPVAQDLTIQWEGLCPMVLPARRVQLSCYGDEAILVIRADEPDAIEIEMVPIEEVLDARLVPEQLGDGRWRFRIEAPSGGSE